MIRACRASRGEIEAEDDCQLCAGIEKRRLTRMDSGDGIGEPIDYIHAKEHLQKDNTNIVDVPLPRIQQGRFILRILREPTFRHSRLLQNLNG
jgi:hypothetical protein